MATAKNVSEQISLILLKDIVVDPAFNGRSGDFTADAGDEEKNNFDDLVESIKMRGQDEAVRVVPKGKKFFLVAGFRRFAAISKIAEEKGDPNATIKAISKDMTSVEMRSLNLRENTARDQLKGADLAWSIHDLWKQMGGKETSDVAVAKEIGLSQPYVSRLLRIMREVVTKVTDAWRVSPVKVSTGEMETLCKVPKDQQMDAYKKLLGKKGEQSEKGPNAWVDSAKKNAAKVASLLGKLEKNELIDTEGLSFADHIDYVVKIKKGANAKQRSAIIKAAQTAYEEALTAEEETEEDSEDESEE
jgi:ParB/RepB/Spo0J family partition protein